LSSVARPALPYFPHCLKNYTIFGKKVEYKICISIFSTTFFSDNFLIYRGIQRDIIVMHICGRFLWKWPLLYSGFNETLSTDFEK
jgi:hypothetical protein